MRTLSSAVGLLGAVLEPCLECLAQGFFEHVNGLGVLQGDRRHRNHDTLDELDTGVPKEHPGVLHPPELLGRKPILASGGHVGSQGDAVLPCTPPTNGTVHIGRRQAAASARPDAPWSVGGCPAPDGGQPEGGREACRLMTGYGLESSADDTLCFRGMTSNGLRPHGSSVG